MKKLLCLILSLTLLIAIIPSGIVASAKSNYLTIEVMEDPETGKIFAYVEACDKNAKGSITIPSTYQGVPVTRIKENAFAYCNKITSVTVPNSVTDIQRQAFFECTSLKKVTLSNKMTKIYPGTFYNCSRLETITLPNNIKEIYTEGFYGCSSLKKINLENITDLYPDAFNGTALKEINLKSIKIIDMRAFINCKNLMNIKFGNKLMAVGFCAFANTAYYNNEDNWENGALYLNNILLSVKPEVSDTFSVKNGTKIIASSALSYCENGDYENSEINQNISKIILPNTITYINSFAFSHCKTLKKINLPNSIKEIGGEVFNECRNLEEITIPKNVKRIENGLFYNCLKLKKVTIPEGVEEIGDHAFWCCWGLSSITLPSTLKKIENYAFYYCAYLKNVTIPSKVTYIGESAFAACHKFTKISIPSCVKYIGNLAFQYCSNLSQISGGKNIEDIGKDLFYETPIYNNKNNYTNGVFYLGSALIKAKPTITSCNIKSGTKVIADEAFLDCSALKTLTMPNSLKTIGESAFENCSSIKNLIIPQGVTTIKASAFKNCSALKTLTIPSSLKNMGVWAFSCCDNITAVYYAGGKKAFYTFAQISQLDYSKIHYNSCIGKPNHTYSNKCDTKCNVCSAKRSITHTYKNIITKATLTKNGKISYKCSVCGYTASKTTTIKKIKSVKLSSTSYTYNGKVKTPSVVVKDSAGKTLKKNTDYTVKYSSGRKNVGKYTVTITFKGKYSGTKKLTFTINPPKTAAKLTAGKKAITVKVTKKTAQVSGYQIQYSTSKSFKSSKTVTLNKNTKTSTTIKKLTAKKTYYVRVRTYKTVGKTKYYSTWSTVVSKKTK